MSLAITFLTICILLTKSTTYLDSTSTSGKATYYGGNDGGGACGYASVATSTFPYGYYAACGGDIFDDGYGCGKCYEVTCVGPYDSSNTGCWCDSSTPTVVVSCMDQCPECSNTHFDLNPAAMTRIVADGLAGTCGVIELTFRRVECDYTTNIQIRAKSGTSAYWYGLHIDNIGGTGSVTEVKIRSNGDSSYDTSCDKSQGASFWICSGGIPLSFPLDVQLTNDAGDVITCDNCIENSNGNAAWDFGTNFGSSSGGGGTNPTTQNAPEPTPRPTPAPTPSPVDNSGGSGGSTGSGKITITNKNGLNEWWYAVVVTDSDGNYMTSDDLSFVKMKDGNMNSYESGTSEWDYWKFTANTPYSPSFSFKIKSKSTGEIIKTTGSIASISEGDSTVITSGFSYTEDNDDDDNKLSWGAWFAIIFCILLIIACIIIGTFCYIKRQKQKGQVEFDEKYQVGDTPTGKSNNTDNNKQTETQQEVEEIEVEMDMETR